jgi:predicted peptidase
MKKKQTIKCTVEFFILISTLALQQGCARTDTGLLVQHAKASIGESSYDTYLLYLPENYYSEKQKAWPLIIFLHGSGAGSSDIQALREMTLAGRLENLRQFPFLVVSPQCGTSESWKPAKLKLFIQKISSRIRVDKKRIYLTGISMGGYATWETAIEYPDMFAAIVPLAGPCDESKACSLKNVPVWAFHGENDRDISPLFSKNMVNAIIKCGGKAKLTILPGVAHNCLRETYSKDELYQWLLENAKE